MFHLRQRCIVPPNKREGHMHHAARSRRSVCVPSARLLNPGNDLVLATGLCRHLFSFYHTITVSSPVLTHLLWFRPRDKIGTALLFIDWTWLVITVQVLVIIPRRPRAFKSGLKRCGLKLWRQLYDQAVCGTRIPFGGAPTIPRHNERNRAHSHDVVVTGIIALSFHCIRVQTKPGLDARDYHRWTCVVMRIKAGIPLHQA
jgi:hypothetical protein